MDDGVAAQLRLEKQVQLKDFTAPGVGEIKSIPTSAVDDILLFVDAFHSAMSFETAGDEDAGAPAPCRDRIHLFQNDPRSLTDKVRADVVRFHVDLTQGQYADQVDTDRRKAFEEHFQQLVQDLDTSAGQPRIRYRTAPPPARRGRVTYVGGNAQASPVSRATGN